MIVAFYVPRCTAYDDLQDKIHKNGGIVIDQHECFTYQIKPEGLKTGFTEYYNGRIYSSKWIIDSITQGKCISSETYFITQNLDEKARKLNIGKKKKYTIIEGIKLYEIITNQKNLQANSSQLWQKVYNQGILPERTADSMKNFWKRNLSKTLEEFLIECVHEGTDFCLSFKDIPNPDFQPRFRQ